MNQLLKTMTSKPKTSRVSELSQAIARKIINGDYTTGELLPGENELCKQWNVSRTSVRGALQVLAAKQFVHTEPKRGTRVNASEQWNWLDQDVLRWSADIKPDKAFTQHLLEARLVFEPNAAALAAMHASAQDLAVVEQCFQRMQAAAESDDRSAFNQNDLLFHQALLKASHNPFMIALGDLLAAVMLASFDATLEEKLTPQGAALEEHFNVFEAVRLRKPKQAKKQMRLIVLMAIDKLVDDTDFTSVLS
jgi:GntR family transcriptional regulator, galactonate operon transcriptional repressor